MRLFSAFAFCLAFAGVVHAQDGPVPALVHYTIDARFESDGEMPYDHPVVRQLASQPQLRALEVRHDLAVAGEAAPSGLVTVSVRLAFESLDDFQAWYRSSTARALMQVLREAAGSTIRTQLAMQRLPGLF